jgi:transcription elongation factor Elf1
MRGKNECAIKIKRTRHSGPFTCPKCSQKIRSRHLSKVLPNDSNPVPILLCNACADAMKMLQKIIGGEIQRKDILEKIKK